MPDASNLVWRLRDDRRGVTALEYGLIAAVVVAAGLASFTLIARGLATKVQCVGMVMDNTARGAAGACGTPPTPD